MGSDGSDESAPPKCDALAVPPPPIITAPAEPPERPWKLAEGEGAPQVSKGLGALGGCPPPPTPACGPCPSGDGSEGEMGSRVNARQNAYYSVKLEEELDERTQVRSVNPTGCVTHKIPQPLNLLITHRMLAVMHRAGPTSSEGSGLALGSSGWAGRKGAPMGIQAAARQRE